MIKTPERTHLKDIEYEKHSEFWENLSQTSTKILDLLNYPKRKTENFVIANPSKTKTSDTTLVSLFLYQISENPLIKNQTMSEFPSSEKRYSFSEHILHYILTVHSKDPIEEINAIEKFLGIIYSNPEIPISNTVKKAHVRINFTDKPIEIWNKLFPSAPYVPSILLTIHGPGVLYLDSEVKTGIDGNFYDSNKF
jgi:hypothetical protein